MLRSDQLIKGIIVYLDLKIKCYGVWFAGLAKKEGRDGPVASARWLRRDREARQKKGNALKDRE